MNTIKIYCDESRQTGCQYMLMGGIWILREYGWEFVNEFEDYCQRELGLVNPLGHMKWTKVPPKPEGKFFSAYLKLIDLYFEYVKAKKMFFRTIVTRHKDYNFVDERFYNGDYESGFYNLYCLLLLNGINCCHQYHIRLASRNIKKTHALDCETTRLEQLKSKLNSKMTWRLKQGIYPVKTIESRNAHERRLIQVADLLMGAVGFHWNGDHLKENAKAGKVFLANYIAGKLGKSDLEFTTKWSNRTFNIFYCDFNKSKYK